MIPVRWTQIALYDLQRISLYIEQQRNLATANRVCRILYDAIQLLRRFPLSGKAGIEEGTRELVIASLPYIVVYRVLNPDAIQILRIWHAAQERSEHT